MLFRAIAVLAVVSAAPPSLRGSGGAASPTSLDEQQAQKIFQNPKSFNGFEDTHKCHGCSGLSGPCITGMWVKASMAQNHPHGMLFCSYYDRHSGACPKGYTDCFKQHPRPDHAAGHAYHHAIRSYHAPPRRAPSGGGGAAGKLAALQKQIAMLKLEREIAALKGGGR